MNDIIFFRPETPIGIKGRWIFTETGQFLTLREWQAINGYTNKQVGKYFYLSERKFKGKNWAISELTIRVADRWREISGSPKKVNSFFRTSKKQQQLIKKGYRAAKISPHQYGLALDIDTISKSDTFKEVKNLKQAAKELGVAIRIGYNQYLYDGMTFIHFDTCPEYFRVGKPWHDIEHSIFWEKENRW